MNISAAHGLCAAALCSTVFVLWACASGSKNNDGMSDLDPDASAEDGSGYGPCGHQGSSCCADGGCTGISYCGKTHVCESNPSDVGQPCTEDSQCMSGLCSYLGGDDAGDRAVCSEPCQSKSDCVAGWTCDLAGQSPVVGSQGQGVCVCTPVTETCDGKDDNCDGKTDEEPSADEACTAAAGVPEKCVAGACVCVSQCGDAGTCTDLTSDSNNCGACGNACLPGVQACSGSECICAGILCPLPAGDAGYLVDDGGADGGPVECVQPTSDPNNCGSCGVTCPSPYSCANGGCQGIELVPGGTNGVSAVISDGTNVFVLAGGSSGTGAIEECAAAGCKQTPTTVTSAVSNASNSGPAGLLALGGSWLYWAEDTAVKDVATANPAATTFATPAGSSIYAVATNSTYVFWSDQNLGILTCAIGSTCASPKTLLALASISGPPQTITADETYVYWTDENGNLYSFPIAGGSPATLATDAGGGFGGAASMVASAGRVYYVDANGAISAAVGGSASSSAVYFSESGAVALATDGTILYWADSQIKKCLLGPSCATPTVLAGASSPTWIAVDASHTYWIATDSNGSSNVYEYAK